MADSPDRQGSDDLVRLNVGGTWYTTTMATLESQPSPIFSNLLQEPDKGALKMDDADSGYYFIDRDGAIFRHVLNFLRTGAVNVPADFAEFDLLMSDAKFYGLTKLENLITEKTAKQGQLKNVEVIEVAHPEKIGLCCTRLVVTDALQEEAPFCDVIDPGGPDFEMYQGQRGRFWVRSSYTRVEWAEVLVQHGWKQGSVTSFCRKIPDITGHGTDIAHIVERWTKPKD